MEIGEIFDTIHHIVYHAKRVSELNSILVDESDLMKLLERMALHMDISLHTLNETIEGMKKIPILAGHDMDFDGLQPISALTHKAYCQSKEKGEIKSVLTGVPSGFRDLDALTSGFQPSDLILVASRPSMGKSSFALNIAAHVAGQLQQSVAFCALAMSAPQISQRMICTESGVDSLTFRNGNLNDDEKQRLMTASDWLAKSKLYIDDTPAITVDNLLSEVSWFKAHHGLSLIVIDYLQLMRGPSERNIDSWQQELSEISRLLKALARELAVPILVTSQLPRSVETRQDKRPILFDLHDYGSLEQDADFVMFLYRDEYYNEESERKNCADIVVAKHRNGSTGTVSLRFEKSIRKFSET